MDIVGYVFLTIGALFMFLGVLGLVRMPDVFNRIQVGTKATTLGFLSIVVGVFFFYPEWWSKLLVIAAFVLMTNPLGSHNLARAAYRRGEKMVIAGVDKLGGLSGAASEPAAAQGRAGSPTQKEAR